MADATDGFGASQDWLRVLTWGQLAGTMKVLRSLSAAIAALASEDADRQRPSPTSYRFPCERAGRFPP